MHFGSDWTLTIRESEVESEELTINEIFILCNKFMLFDQRKHSHINRSLSHTTSYNYCGPCGDGTKSIERSMAENEAMAALLVSTKSARERLSGTCLRHVVSVSCVATDVLMTQETSSTRAKRSGGITCRRLHSHVV
jgi:hypothetical protein